MSNYASFLSKHPSFFVNTSNEVAEGLFTAKNGIFWLKKSTHYPIHIRLENKSNKNGMFNVSLFSLRKIYLRKNINNDKNILWGLKIATI